MSSSSSTARASLGSIFGAIASTAHAVTATVSSVTTGAEALNAYVGTAAAKQAIDNKLSLADYEDEALTRLALANAERIARVRAHMNKSDDAKQDFMSSYTRLQLVLHPKAQDSTPAA